MASTDVPRKCPAALDLLDIYGNSWHNFNHDEDALRHIYPVFEDARKWHSKLLELFAF